MRAAREGRGCRPLARVTHGSLTSWMMRPCRLRRRSGCQRVDHMLWCAGRRSGRGARGDRRGGCSRFVWCLCLRMCDLPCCLRLPSRSTQDGDPHAVTRTSHWNARRAKEVLVLQQQCRKWLMQLLLHLLLLLLLRTNVGVLR